MPSTTRSKAPLRWAVILISGLATAGFWSGIINGPQPTHASPPPTPVVVQQAPTLSQMVNQGENDGGFSGSFASQSAMAPQPRFRTRGS